ncbi:MAG: hypothetical protein ACXADX_21335 [Candidatus Hodarchaeales archaeon]
MSGIILGNLPFVGVSYRGHHHARFLTQEFSSHKTMRTLHEQALQAGIREFAIQVPENDQMKIHWKILSEISNNYLDMSVIPNIGISLLFDAEPLDVYRRWATVIGGYDENAEKILKIVTKDKILQCRPNWESLISKAVNENKRLPAKEIRRVKLDLENIERAIERLSVFKIQFLEFGSEVDFLVASGRIDMIGELVDLGQTYGYPVGFGVHHAALSLPTLDRIERIKGVLTPMNPIGMMMFPSQAEAIKILAGGHHPQVKESLHFLARQGIKRFMVGVSSSSELSKVVNEWNDLSKAPS